MKIGILGTGSVGQELGAGFVQLGYEVKMGSRDPNQEKVKAWLERVGPPASAGTFAEAAAFADIAVLATRWTGTENAIKLADPKNLAGKVVMDTTNPLDFSAGYPPTLTLGHTDSAGEQVQRWLPEAYVVKAFNIVGSSSMVRPQFSDGPPDMFICGNNAQAKETVTKILQAFGWPVFDIGGIEGARYLEPLAMLWMIYSFKTKTRDHAFKLLRK